MPPGSPNLFKAEIGRNLNKVFPPALGGFDVPQILSGVVSLTHDFLATKPYDSFSIYDLIGSVDVISISQALTPPDGYLWLVDEMDIFTDDTAARLLSLDIHYIGGAGNFAIRVFKQTSGAAGADHYPVGRRLILPPGAFFELSVPALTAGKKLRLTFMYLQLPLGQFVPKS
jgi:hypothetical protein